MIPVRNRVAMAVALSALFLAVSPDWWGVAVSSIFWLLVLVGVLAEQYDGSVSQGNGGELDG